MPVLQLAMGEEVFATSLNYQRSQRSSARDARSKRAKQDAVADPAAHAARRSVKADGKKRNKARRMVAFKALRGAGTKRVRE
jgi:hypothetical protein